MARKRFRTFGLTVMAVVTLGAEAAQGQDPSSAAASVAAAVGAASPRAAIWAATAEYVYKDDRDLTRIQPELLKTIKSSSLQAFNLSVDAAVAVEKKQQPGPNHLLKFQELVKTTQALPLAPSDPAALVRVIVGKLGKNPARMADPARARQFKLLEQQLTQLAAVDLPAALVATVAAQPGAGPAVPDPVPVDAPAAPETAVIAAPAAAAPAGGGAPAWVSWLALVVALLSAGLAFLRRGAVAPAPAPEVVAPHAGRSAFEREKDLKELVKKMVREEVAKTEFSKLSTPAVAAAAPVATVPAPALPPLPDSVEAMLAPLPVAPAASRQRTQYANEAPFNNAFPARALSDQPGTYSTFAIVSSEQQPDQGLFAVTGNLASHVRDHRSVLEPVCEYVSGYPLGSESRVVMVEPGHVRRRGDDWEVVQRAKVRFE